MKAMRRARRNQVKFPNWSEGWRYEGQEGAGRGLSNNDKSPPTHSTFASRLFGNTFFEVIVGITWPEHATKMFKKAFVVRTIAFVGIEPTPPGARGRSTTRYGNRVVKLV
ncbi:unnamed protein product, partial [Iphiclides podalirius]